MENLKIRVNSADESKEAQGLLFEMGFQWRGLKSPFDLFYPTSMDNYYILLTKGSKEMQIAGAFRDGLRAWKEITLPELRAMVNPMKEYINKTTGEYRKTSDVVSGEQWMGIPDGAECLTKCIDSNNDTWFLFWKGNYKICVGHDGDWCDFEADVKEYLSRWSARAHILWQRATHPEELPFIDDEPKSINDQYAEIEQVRQVEIHGTVKAAQASGGVDATLAERQSTYGNFEDVAFVTENIIHILAKVRVNGLDDLPNTHRMALHMIASKMARIVNGDFNHLDSWHDIGGYSKLIEKLIKGE